jgi:hypothetical protein
MTQLAGITNLRRFDRMFEVTNRLRTQGADLPGYHRWRRAGRPLRH